jgi:hypothetical protein
MAVEYRGAGAVASGAGNVEPALPEGWQPEDLLVLQIESGSTTPLGETSNVPPAEGWTLRVTEVKKPGGESFAGLTRLTIYTKVAGKEEVAPVVGDVGDHQIAVVHALKKGTFNAASPILSANITTGPKGTIFCPEAVATGTPWAFAMFFCSTTGPLGGGNSESQLTFALSAGEITELVERADVLREVGDAGQLGAATGHLPN